MDVRNHAEEQRFEVEQDGELAFLEYTLRPESITLYHTQVPPALEGHGIGSTLAKAGLDFARANQLRVVPTCPFVSAYLKRHPEYQDLVTPKLIAE
jgi:predicted GNAT family acetyltransferase